MKQQIFECTYKWSFTACFLPSCPRPRFPCSLFHNIFFFPQHNLLISKYIPQNHCQGAYWTEHTYEVYLLQHYSLKKHATWQSDTKLCSVFTTLALLKVYSLLAWEEKNPSFMTLTLIDISSFEKGTKGGKTKAFPLPFSIADYVI